MWKRFNSRGQAGLEVLLITVFIITISFLVISIWFNLNDETKAITLFKSAAIEKLSQSDKYYVLRKVEVAPTSTGTRLDLIAYITPQDFLTSEAALALEIRNLADDLEAKTNYATINISVR
jgi:hypothetical protein